MQGEVIIFYIVVVVVIFGYFHVKNKQQKKEFARIASLNPQQKQLELMRLQSQIDQNKTSHFVHILLTFVTCFMWLFVWALVAWSNASKRKQIDELMKQVVDSKN